MPGEAELPRLLAQARLGDQLGWDALVARYTPLVWAVARGHGLPSKPAADVTHTTWLRLVESLDQVSDGDVGRWLAAVARAESVQALRWVDPRPDRRAAPPDPIWTAVELLPPRCRFALRLLAVEPAPSAAELAVALDATPEAAQAFADDSLHRLAELLADATTH